VAPRSRNPDMDWVIEHCPKITTGNTMFVQLGTTMQRCRCDKSVGLRAERLEDEQDRRSP
jgi:hypothetical protein